MDDSMSCSSGILHRFDLVWLESGAGGGNWQPMPKIQLDYVNCVKLGVPVYI